SGKSGRITRRAVFLTLAAEWAMGSVLVSIAVVFVSPPGTPPTPAPAKEPVNRSPEDRALAYLAKAVPPWSPDSKCFACHNNGDAARALYTATRLSYRLPAKALDDTSAWLAQPHRWDRNGGEGPYSDKMLARLQFAAALVEAVDAGQV